MFYSIDEIYFSFNPSYYYSPSNGFHTSLCLHHFSLVVSYDPPSPLKANLSATTPTATFFQLTHYSTPPLPATIPPPTNHHHPPTLLLPIQVAKQHLRRPLRDCYPLTQPLLSHTTTPDVCLLMLSLNDWMLVNKGRRKRKKTRRREKKRR